MLHIVNLDLVLNQFLFVIYFEITARTAVYITIVRFHVFLEGPRPIGLKGTFLAAKHLPPCVVQDFHVLFKCHFSGRSVGAVWALEGTLLLMRFDVVKEATLRVRAVGALRAVLVLVLVMALEVVVKARLSVAVERALVALELYLVGVSVVDMHFEVVGGAGAVLTVRAVVQLTGPTAVAATKS